MASFDVLAWLENCRRGDFERVSIQQPIETGACWSRTSILHGGQYNYGDTNGLLPYTGPEVPASLDEGFPEKYVPKPKEGHVHVDLVVKALRHANVALGRFDVVSFRNNFNKIVQTVTDNSASWAVDACVLSELPGTVFLNIHSTAESDYPNAERFCYYGYKFESLSTGGGREGVVDATSEFAVVAETRLQGLRCAIAAEMDCYDPRLKTAHSPVALSAMIELKTARMIESERQKQNVQRFKYPKWWIQSFIVGVPRIVVGYWAKDGTLAKVESVPTQELPSRALDGIHGYMRNQVWRPEQLLGFLHAVLQWMGGLVRTEPNKEFHFFYRPEQKLVVGEASDDGTLVRRIRQVMDSHP